MECPACHQTNVEGARFCAKCGALLPIATGDANDSMVGQIVGGRYRITQLLGEGGMGRVYLAEQQMGTNVRKVAVKTLQAQFVKDPQVLARFHRECGTVSELEHPNTIHFFDFGQTPDGQLYIAMEFVQGQSLSDALLQGPMRPDRVLRILAQACGSLEEAHGRGVVHRDLKPDNLILSNRAGQADFVKVLDFGIAKRSEAKDQAQEQKLTQQGMVLGTPPYMSPEQFTGKELDLRSDIYSLAVMAYEMLTGRLPFEADTPWQWATQHMTAQPFPFDTLPVAAGIPQAMKQGIMRGLSKDRDHRQSSVRQFYEELAGGGTGVSASAPPVAPVPPHASHHGPPPAPGGTVPIPAYGAGNAGFAPHPSQLTPHPVAHLTPAGGQTFPTSPQPQTGGAQPKKSGKGLLIGLGAGVGVLAIVGVVVARQMGGGTEPEPAPTKSAAPPAATPEKTAEPSPAVVVDAAAKTVVTTAPVTTLKKAPTATPSVAPTPAPTAPALTGDAACAEAKRLGENGDAAGAARVFAGCSGPGAGVARGAIARSAPAAVQRRIFNGDCAGAKALVAALSAIGATGGAEATLNNAVQCKK
ncbi:MAG TPA: protein kinase [Polyangiaceae bacterium]|nr:protein kinase [Polyangiaceae bacterium]